MSFYSKKCEEFQILCLDGEWESFGRVLDSNGGYDQFQQVFVLILRVYIWEPEHLVCFFKGKPESFFGGKR